MFRSVHAVAYLEYGEAGHESWEPLEGGASCCFEYTCAPVVHAVCWEATAVLGTHCEGWGNFTPVAAVISHKLQPLHDSGSGCEHPVIDIIWCHDAG